MMPPPQKDTPFKTWLGKKGQSSAEGRPATPDLPAPEVLIPLIEKDVPLPSPKQAYQIRYHELFAAMAVGDSFPTGAEHAKRLTQAAHHWGKARGRKFACRRVDPSTHRIWRIA